MSNKFKTVDQLEIKNNNLMQAILDELIRREGDQIKNKMEKDLRNHYTPMFFEAKEYNVYDEYMAIKGFVEKRGFKDNYEKGRFKMLEFMINCIIAEPINGNYYCNEYGEIAKEAGRLLETEDAMWDELVWSFVPKRFRRDFDCLWDGIGSWMG